MENVPNVFWRVPNIYPYNNLVEILVLIILYAECTFFDVLLFQSCALLIISLGPKLYNVGTYIKMLDVVMSTRFAC